MKTSLPPLDKRIVTKDYLKIELNKVQSNFNGIYYRLDRLEERMDKFEQKFEEFKDQVFMKLDWLVGAFQKFDQEHTILTGNYASINGAVDDHEKRITSLEKTTSH